MPSETAAGRAAARFPSLSGNNLNLSAVPGESVRFEYSNLSMASHPMHLHGHFFEVAGSGLSIGVRIRKDTLVIPSMGSGAVEFVADNSGDWLHHCHNLYHHAGGMANVVKVA
ncbi:MAG: multicopper oxidase domain-containing protein [Thermodesulfovibrionales bacterium]